MEPHFTLVFPIVDIEENKFIEEVKDKVSNTTRFDFVVRSATYNLDFSKEYFHEFLVPDEGNSNLIELHDSLYSGTLRKYLSWDIDFIPHIGIGNSDNREVCRDNVDKLNKNNINIKGSVDSIDIVKYENDKVTTILDIPLM